MLAYVAAELFIPSEVQDTFDPCTVAINLIRKDGTFQLIDSLEELEDSMRLLIDCQVKSFKEQQKESAVVAVKEDSTELIPVK